MPRRALLVDDERLPRQELRRMLALHPEVEVVGEADSVESAAGLLAQERPDLIFLDIQLGERTGFELLEQVPGRYHVIFVTAYQAHAARAFEVNAFDYLLKPVHPDRLRAALARLPASSPSSAPATSADGALEPDDRLFIRATGDRWCFLRIGSIVVIEANGDFTNVLTTDGANLLLGRSLREWEASLPRRFLRIHRSTIVNLDHVERVEEWSGQAFNVYVRGMRQPYPMSRRRVSKLRA